MMDDSRVVESQWGGLPSREEEAPQLQATKTIQELNEQKKQATERDTIFEKCGTKQ